MVTLLFCVFLIFSSAAKAQSNELPISKIWKIDFVEMGGQKVDEIGDENTEMDYEFKSDNTYIIYSPQGIDKKGNWEFNSEEKCVYFRNEYGEIEGKILNISKERITLIPAVKIGKFPEMEFVKFHYIPK